MKSAHISQRTVSMPKGRRFAVLLVLSWPLLGLIGCGTIPRNPVPLEQMDQAQVPDLPGIRSYATDFSKNFQKDFVQSVRDEPPGLYPLNADGTKPYSVLILSGGGEKGAFGAGFLNGWTQAGTRPMFKGVTGISTGALIAPFAFLGPDYDETLRALFTSSSRKDIIKRRLSADSLSNSRPLERLIAQYVTEDVIQKVAAEHSRGRRLYIGTTNMDAQRLVVWNMGAIAHSDHPDSLALFRKIMLASASIPVFMPPVMFEVEVGGKRYDELHADGGTVSQMFFIGTTMDLASARKEFGFKAGGTKLYIIRNDQSEPVADQVERRLADILPRTIQTVMKAQSHGDIMRIYILANANGIDFNYVEVPKSYVKKEKGMFNTNEMRRLFALGLEAGAAKNPWRKQPYLWKRYEKMKRAARK
ncbi:MAG: patatin-like phospholipase family protein [Gammaproteobacteria bacterium]|nr:MAG: patatin-like phospholipase family protein [Gammaproteobacteria bacterium]